MTAAQIIEEIKKLPATEQHQVLEFARHAAETRPLSPDELGELAKKMVETDDPKEADRLKQAIKRGFYGDSRA